LAKKPPKSKDRAERPFPTREQILEFIAENPGSAGKREIARAFGISGGAKIALKAILKNLAEEGAVEKKHRHLRRPADLANVSVLAITGRDPDGELLAEPVEWPEENDTPPKIVIVPDKRGKSPVPGIGDRVLGRLARNSEGTYDARVIKILDRKPLTTLGVVRIAPDGIRLEPVDKKQKELVLEPDSIGKAKEGDLVSVVTTRSGRYGLPRARIKEIVGSMKSEKAVSLIAILTHGIPQDFSAEAIKEAEAAKPATMTDREDWRDLPLLTIDPPDAKDHDDAVHTEPDKDPKNPGGVIVTVAIADVAYYVRPGSGLDREAVNRGNSVYFPDRVVPMLPERISNDLCSLVPGTARGALAVRMVIGKDGRKRSHTFHRVLMRSAAKLHYAQAQAAIDGHTDDTTDPLLKPVLTPLWDAYAAVKKARDEREPLDLDLPERKILLKADGTVDRVITPERLDAHKLIEEFMILANVAAAETLEKKVTPLIYRVHDEPGREKVVALREFLQTLEISFPKTGAVRPELFNRTLREVKGHDSEPLVNEIVLRSQAQAEYAAENYGHFGLNLRRYAHFTSPIRRYADLVVHRALVRALGLGAGGLPETETLETLSEIAANISATERRAMKAERETTDRLIAHFLADRVGATFKGRISGVTRAGLFVKLDDTGADGLIPIRTLGGEYYQYDEARHALIGTRSGAMHRLGDTVEVRLVEAAPVAGALRFELLSEGAQAPRGPRGAFRPRDDRRPGQDRTERTFIAAKRREKPGKKSKPENVRAKTKRKDKKRR
jgi:ribonuclease R